MSDHITTFDGTSGTLPTSTGQQSARLSKPLYITNPSAQNYEKMIQVWNPFIWSWECQVDLKQSHGWSESKIGFPARILQVPQFLPLTGQRSIERRESIASATSSTKAVRNRLYMTNFALTLVHVHMTSGSFSNLTLDFEHVNHTWICSHLPK